MQGNHRAAFIQKLAHADFADTELAGERGAHGFLGDDRPDIVHAGLGLFQGIFGGIKIGPGDDFGSDEFFGAIERNLRPFGVGFGRLQLGLLDVGVEPDQYFAGMDQGACRERDFAHGSFRFSADDGSLDRHDRSHGRIAWLPNIFAHLEKVYRLRRHHLLGTGIAHGFELENLDPEDAAHKGQHDDDANDGPEYIFCPFPRTFLSFDVTGFCIFHGVLLPARRPCLEVGAELNLLNPLLRSRRWLRPENDNRLALSLSRRHLSESGLLKVLPVDCRFFG